MWPNARCGDKAHPGKQYLSLLMGGNERGASILEKSPPESRGNSKELGMALVEAEGRGDAEFSPAQHKLPFTCHLVM